MRWPYARYSKDVDLLRVSPGESLDAAVEALVAAATAKTGDHPRFEFFDVAHEMTADRPTTKVRFTAYFGLAEYTKVGVDVVTNLLPRSEPTTELLESPFPIGAPAWPTVPVRMWPLPDHVADKIAAMYEVHGVRLLPSSRVKDLIDIILIASETPLPGPRTHTALREEVARRQTNNVRINLPEEFALPDATWAERYAAEASKTPGLKPEFHSIVGSQQLADAFVTPLLQEKPPPGDWNPEQRQWV